MYSFEPRLILKKEVRFSESLEQSKGNSEENFGDVFGGVIKSRQWGWLTKGSSLRITSLRTGQLISKFDFDDSNGFGMSIITCVTEVHVPFAADTIIAIGIQYADCPGGLAVIYSIEESTVIRCIEMKHKITSCTFIGYQMSQHTVLQNMNGCLAIGTDGGRVLLVDLNLLPDEVNLSTTESNVSIVPCHIVDFSMSLLHLHRHFQHCQQERVHFAIQLEVLDNAAFVQSLLPIDVILSLAVGLADGRLALYDLTDMQVFYVAPPQERSSPLVKLNFMEPPDDPRPCVYIWAFHENYQNSIAVLHSLMYEKRVIVDGGFCFFENFQMSCVRLQLPLNCPKSVPITCQAVTKSPSHGNDETISLCALVWKQDKELQTEVLLFDINQWYKEEMPYVGDWRDDPSYLASFILPGVSALEVYFNPNTISLFNSIQRPEEHFYPIALSFDCVALTENRCMLFNWPGVQNQVINVLRSKGSLALLDPNVIFEEMLRTRLLPQFSGYNYKSTFSLKAKREILLSIAIEQNCVGLLRECARSWSDGSHIGKSLSDGLSMSTLTDWLWTRASSTKERCNKLCQVLFDHSGCTLDQREQKELTVISKQLKTLAHLLNEIITKFGENVPSDVLSTMESQCKLIEMASDYQEILLWLLNIGLLPEASRLTGCRSELNLVPYPYESLRRFYDKRRMEFTQLNEHFSSRKTKSCYLLFIDSFIQHEFQSNSLSDRWQENGGNGLYPPTSIQAMLRIMLIPDVTFENKCALFLYFFLDLNMAIEDRQYEPIVQNFIKFPSVFKLSASLIKQIQAFWNLDHCRFQAAVDEFVSPFNKDHVCPQWQLELFLESLLAQSEANLALRVLEAKSSNISPVLQLNTYLANNLVSEAFHFARSKQDEELLKLFFTGCLCAGKFGVIRDLALTESEGNLVQSLLKNCKSRNAENLHFVYLLQKYKYIEAVAYLDEISNSRERVIQRTVDVDTPTLVLSAYNTTMTPVTKGLSDVYFKIKNKIKSKETDQSSPYPLSCQLIKQNANELLGGIYHSSALSAHFASYYWQKHQSEENTLQQSANAPFLRRPQAPSYYADYDQKDCISYPEPYKIAQKHRLDSSATEEERDPKARDNPKKRRRIDERSDLIFQPLYKNQLASDNLLTHFKNKTGHGEEISSFIKRFQKSPTKKQPSYSLETPFVKNMTKDDSGNIGIEKSGTALQGILKLNLPKMSADETDCFDSEKKEKKDIEEEKSIRFILPPDEDESEDQIDKNDVPKDTEEIEDGLRRESPVLFQKYMGPAKRKSLRTCSSYVPSSRVLRSQSPLKKDKNTFNTIQSPIKSTVAARFVSEKDEHILPMELPVTSTVLGNVQTDDSEESAYNVNMDSNDHVKSRPINITQGSSKSDVEHIDNSVVRLSKPRPCGVVGSRPPLRNVIKENVAQDSDPRWISKKLRSKATDAKPQTEEQWGINDADSQDNAKIIPIVLLAENCLDDRLKPSKPEIISDILIKPPIRETYESSENETSEALSCAQRSIKQLKSREPIHGSFGNVSDNAASKQGSNTQTKVQSLPSIDFKPHISSSRVCTTESKFHVNASEIPKVEETETTFFEKVTSKVKYSERSTLVGGLTYMPTLESIQHVTETKSAAFKPGSHMMDTTIDMTLYDTLETEKSHENFNKIDSSSDSKDQEEESYTSESNRQESQESENSVDNGDSSSVILLSSRSSSRKYDESSSEYSESRASKSTVGQILIEDENDDDEDSDVVDMIDESDGDVLENSYSNQFSEVTRTSTSCSLRSNTETVLSSAAEIEEETNFSRQIPGELDEFSNTNSLIVAVDEKDADRTENEVLPPEKPYETSQNNDKPLKLIPAIDNAQENLLISSTNVETASRGENLQMDLLVTEDRGTQEPEKKEIVNVEKNQELNSIEEKNRVKEIIICEDQQEIVNETSTADVVLVTEFEKRTETVRNDVSVLNKEIEKEEAKLNEATNDTHAVVVVEQNTSQGVPSEYIIQDDKSRKQINSQEFSSPSKNITETPLPCDDNIKETINEPDNQQVVKDKVDRSVHPEEIEDETNTVHLKTDEPEKTQVIESELTPNLRRKRSQSIPKNLTAETNVPSSPHNRRQSRAGSVPPSTAGQIVTRRRSMLLETLDETVTPDSPSSRTRSKIRLDSIDDTLDSPSVSGLKRTRLSSISSATSIEQPQTPKNRRRSTTSVDKELSVTPKAVGTPRTARRKSFTSEIVATPIKTPRRLSISKNDSPTNQSETIDSTSKMQLKENEDSPKMHNAQTEISQSEDYKSSRRLTRTQLAALEKSAALANQISVPTGKVIKRRTSRTQKESPPSIDVKDSDSESISSRISHLSNASSRRITRSLAQKEHAEDDIISIASSTESGKRRRKRTKETTTPNTSLTAIPEEDLSESEGSVAKSETSKRSRRQKK